MAKRKENKKQKVATRKKEDTKQSKDAETKVKDIDNALPQNILPVGEHVEENKNIYILQEVYKKIHKFTKNKTTNESGGMLIGNIMEEFGKTNIIINGFIEAKYSEGTPTTLKFTHETWEYVHKEMDKRFPEQKIVGWIHTHPNFGIFLSEYDKFIQSNFFKEDYQVAHVVDPIQHIEGFYFWINERIERCKGFYIYDKPGIKIELEEQKENEKKEITKKEEKEISLKDVLNISLGAGLLILVFACVNLSGRINNMEEKLEKITTENQVNQNNIVSQVNQILMSVNTEIANMSDTVTAIDEELHPKAVTVISGEAVDSGTEADKDAEQTENATQAGVNTNEN